VFAALFQPTVAKISDLKKYKQSQQHNSHFSKNKICYLILYVLVTA
jgi:hypothetical protein